MSKASQNRGQWAGKPQKVVAWLYPSGAMTWIPFAEYMLAYDRKWSSQFTRSEMAKRFRVTERTIDRWVKGQCGPVEIRKSNHKLQFRLPSKEKESDQ